MKNTIWEEFREWFEFEGKWKKQGCNISNRQI